MIRSKRAQTFEIFYLIASIILVAGACLAVLNVKYAIPTDVNTASSKIIEMDRAFDTEVLFMKTSSQQIINDLDVLSVAKRTAKCANSIANEVVVFDRNCAASDIISQYQAEFNDQMLQIEKNNDLARINYVDKLHSIVGSTPYTAKVGSAVANEERARIWSVINQINAPLNSRDYYVSFKNTETSVKAIVIARQPLRKIESRPSAAPNWEIEALRDVYFNVDMSAQQQFNWYFLQHLSNVTTQIDMKILEFNQENLAAQKAEVTDDDLNAFANKVQTELYVSHPKIVSNSNALINYALVRVVNRQLILLFPNMNISVPFLRL